MANNIGVAEDISGKTVPELIRDVATDECSDVHYQVVKVNLGGAGVAGGIWDGSISVSSAAVERTVSVVELPNDTSTEVAAENTSRRGTCWLENHSDTENMWVNFGAAAAANTCCRLNPGGTLIFSDADTPCTQAIYAYQASGGALNIIVVEGE